MEKEKWGTFSLGSHNLFSVGIRTIVKYNRYKRGGEDRGRERRLRVLFPHDPRVLYSDSDANLLIESLTLSSGAGTCRHMVGGGSSEGGGGFSPGTVRGRGRDIQG